MKFMMLLCSSLLGLSMVGSAQAGSVGSTLGVSATVVPICSVNTSPVAFGTYSGSQIVASGTINVTCTDLWPFFIALDGGANYQPGQRRMSNGAGAYLAYALYTDPELTNYWGDFGYGDTTFWTPALGTGTGAQTGYAVYGAVFGGQDTAEGSYSDLVNVTIHY